MKKNAFTLAEILITICILGVIAALTLPAIKANIDKSTWANGLKASMSVLQNGFSLMLAQEDVESLSETNFWTSKETSSILKNYGTSEQKELDDVKNELNKYFNVDKVEKNGAESVKIYNLTGTTNSLKTRYARINLANSTSFGIHNITASANNQKEGFEDLLAEIYIDVNGNKRPNVIGKDIFMFILDEKGRLHPHGGDHLYAFNSSVYPKWDSEDGCQGKQPKKGGAACTARVIDEHFTITYD